MRNSLLMESTEQCETCVMVVDLLAVTSKRDDVRHKEISPDSF